MINRRNLMGSVLACIPLFICKKEKVEDFYPREIIKHKEVSRSVPDIELLPRKEKPDEPILARIREHLLEDRPKVYYRKYTATEVKGWK